MHPYLHHDLKRLGVFLKTAKIEDAPIIPLPMDASKRYYYRLQGTQKLVMVCPPSEKPEQFLKISALLNNMGLHAPQVLASEGDFYLIEDFGSNTYSHVLNDANRKALYTLAVDVLIQIKDTLTNKPDFLIDYGAQVLLEEVLLFIDWYKEGLQAPKASYADIWCELLEAIDVPKCLILRDFHKDNLFFLPHHPGLRACGLIDFQDGAWGPVTYDLVSLTEDARIDVPEDLRQFLKERYFNAFPLELQNTLHQASLILDMQRQLRILGVFKRLSVRDGKHHYLDYIPRILGYVRRNLEYSCFKPLKRWFHTYDVL